MTARAIRGYPQAACAGHGSAHRRSPSAGAGFCRGLRGQRSPLPCLMPYRRGRGNYHADKRSVRSRPVTGSGRHGCYGLAMPANRGRHPFHLAAGTTLSRGVGDGHRQGGGQYGGVWHAQSTAKQGDGPACGRKKALPSGDGRAVDLAGGSKSVWLP